MNVSYKVLILLFLFSQALISQNINGEATYKVSYSKSIDNESKSFSEYENMLHQETSKLSFMLKFNRTEYSFEHIYEMSIDNRTNLALVMGGAKGVFYGNLKEDLRLQKKESFGENFIIKSSFRKMEWEILNEFKTIDEYRCAKAVLTEDIQTSKGMEKRTITAWFTTEIPLPYGPIGYGNLPGLILELNFGSKYTYYCDNISFSKSELEINRPKKGKVVTEEEYNFMSKKAYDLRKQRSKN